MKIYIVGIGPGEKEQMTERAIHALQSCEVIAGYNYYIELIQDFTAGKEIIQSAMMGEVERCQKAIDAALTGKCVAVVSSGDAGIYGMASIIFELAENHPQLDIEVILGVTAACSGAAVLGAPLSHDFAVISLSDLMTDWQLIEKRLRCAAEADFVIALYNPSSKKRADYLAKACRIVKAAGGGNPVCAIVRNIGRDGESFSLMDLNKLEQTPVDMFTTVFIGNSRTRIINGRMVTPRGYI